MESDNTASSNESRSASESLRTSSDNVHLKVLVPSVAAGAIIGRGGEAIAQIQKDTETKVKMSKQTDFYPGTTERICLIVGKMSSVLTVHNYIMTHIRDKKDSIGPNGGGATPTSPQSSLVSSPDSRQHGDRSQQVKILVPNTTAGMIIGKGGAYIKEIKQKSGAFIQISQKAKDVNLLERTITIAGEMDQCRTAVEMIVSKIAEDPQSSSCPNTSYADVPGPIASAFPTGSPYAQRINQNEGPASLSLYSPPSLGPAFLSATGSTLSHSAPSYLTLQSSPAGAFVVNNPIAFNTGLNLLSPTESLNLSNASSSVGGNTPMTGFSGPSHSHQHPQHHALVNDLFVSAFPPTAAHHQTLFSAQSPLGLSPTLNSAAATFLNTSHTQQTQQQHRQQQQSPPSHPGAGYHPAILMAANAPRPNLMGVGGFSYSLPIQKHNPSMVQADTVQFNVQIPDEFTAVIADAQSELQRQYGVSIRIHLPGSGADLSGSSGPTDSTHHGRWITISGTQPGVEGALVCIHQHLEYQRMQAGLMSASSGVVSMVAETSSAHSVNNTKSSSA